MNINVVYVSAIWAMLIIACVYINQNRPRH